MASGLASHPDVLEAVETISWSTLTEEAVELLRQYLRFPTVNDPFHLTDEQVENAPWLAGNEAAAAQWLKSVLEKEGIAAELLESAPNRISLIARLKSENPQKPPLVLLSHSDVVPAEAGWDKDPFSGAVYQGYIYGRGALDLKGLGIAHLLVFLLLSRRRTPLNRDVILLIVADEEAGGRFGAQWVLQQRPELLASSVVLGEGGFSVQKFWQGRDIHAIAVAEKGCIELEVSVVDTGNHASMPSPSSAPIRLINALRRVLRADLPVRLTPPTVAFLCRLASAVPGLRGKFLRMPGVFPRLLVRHLRNVPAINAMLQDTVALTILESGTKGNLVPGQSRAVLNLRLLPGSSQDEMMARVRRLADDPGAEIRCTHAKAANTCDFHTPEFLSLEKYARADGNDGIVVPILSPGASDCRHWRYAGINCYGWVPFPISHEELNGVHGRNERVAITSLRHGLRALYQAVQEIVRGPEMSGKSRSEGEQA